MTDKIGYFIFSNGSCGSTLLQRLLDSHSQLRCEMEEFSKSFPPALQYYQKRAREELERGILYGNKLPLEQVLARYDDRWEEQDYLTLAKEFKFIFLFRSPSAYLRSWNEHQTPQISTAKGLQWWQQAWKVAWAVLDQDPHNILFVQHERIVRSVESTVIEMQRICEFLKVSYEKEWWVKQDISIYGALEEDSSQGLFEHLLKEAS